MLSKHVQPKAKLIGHGKIFWAAFYWAHRTQLYTMDGDPDSDRKGVTANVILATLQNTLPEILEKGIFFIQNNALVNKAYLVQEWLTNWAYVTRYLQRSPAGLRAESGYREARARPRSGQRTC